MNTNSNSYTIIYASVMVVIVAFLLAFCELFFARLAGKERRAGYKEADSFFTGHQGVQDAEAEFAKW